MNTTSHTLLLRQLLFLFLSPEELLQVVLILDRCCFVLCNLLHPLNGILDRQIILDLRSIHHTPSKPTSNDTPYRKSSPGGPAPAACAPPRSPLSSVPLAPVSPCTSPTPHPSSPSPQTNSSDKTVPPTHGHSPQLRPTPSPRLLARSKYSLLVSTSPSSNNSTLSLTSPTHRYPMVNGAFSPISICFARA